MSDKTELNCTLFDGVNVFESATVVTENGMIADITVNEKPCETSLFLMPGLIDSHTHLSSQKQIDKLLKNGVTTTCDVSVSKELYDNSDLLKIHSSFSMALGNVSDGIAYVENAVQNGADYIKVILEQPARMAAKTMKFSVLRDIVKTAHEHNLKVAVHAVTVSTVRMAVDAGVDILIHVPIKEEFPQDLAKQISEQGISVVPTLVMMNAFSKSLRFGYKKEHYRNTENAVSLLHSCGVNIVAGTDSNNAVFVPKIAHGSSLHEELELLVKAGLTPVEALRSATSNAAEAFGINTTDFILIKGRPDKNISDSKKIKDIFKEK